MKIKKIIALLFVFALAVSLCACTKPAETETDNAQKIELTLSMHDPIGSNNGKFYQEWANSVSEATNGNVTVTIHASATLASAADVADMVESGGVDLGWVFTSFYAGQFPLTDVVTLPMIGFGDPVVGTNVLWDLYEKYPEMANEWAGFKLLNLYGNPGNIFCSKDKPVDSADDIKGLIMRAPGGPLTTFVTKLGGSPISMSPPDMYEAMQKNNITAFIFETAGVTNFKLQDVTDYYTELPLCHGVFSLIMNQEKWDSLPKEYQDAIASVTGRTGSIAAAENFAAAAESSRTTITEAGGEFIQFAEADVPVLQAAADEIANEWAAGLTTDKFDGKAFLDDATALAKQYSEK